MKTKLKEDVRYDQCPFCDRLFVDRSYVGNGLYKRMLGVSELYIHVEADHNKRWIVKGNKGRWMSIDLINKLLR